MPKSKETAQLEQDAASWRALAPCLPEILRRGVANLLSEPAEPAEPADAEAPALTEIISWRDMPNADLLHQESEAAQDEKARRSFEAIAAFKDYSLVPSPAAVASHAEVGEPYVFGWMRNRAPDYLERLRVSLEAHGTDLASASGRNAKAIRKHSGGKNIPLRKLMKWDEALGSYEWPR